MQTRTIVQSILGGLLALSMTTACGSDSVGNDGATVGGSCQVDADCDEECLSGGDFPQGTCSVSCNADDDCPGGTNCIDTEGGQCLLACDLPSDCRGGYTCKGKNNKGHGGESLVCIKD
jgi:hypothetical protein